ncbi:MAG: c-type cytochrome [Pseudomonadota bacterium]
MIRLCMIWTALLLAGMPARAGDVAYGKYLSSQCVTCHQTTGADQGIPAIVGWDEEAFAAVMLSYKSKERAHPVMQMIAGGLDSEQIAALAAFFATLRPQD